MTPIPDVAASVSGAAAPGVAPASGVTASDMTPVVGVAAPGEAPVSDVAAPGVTPVIGVAAPGVALFLAWLLLFREQRCAPRSGERKRSRWSRR